MNAILETDRADILARRNHLGWDYWTTKDHRIGKGSPFSTLDAAMLLLETGMEPSDPILEETARLILSTLREDGRFRQAPSGGIYPCQTIHALQVLCHLGLGDDPGLDRSFRHLLEIQWEDGGWRCNKFSYGRGPETDHSNPGPTLTALDAFRLSGNYGTDPRLDRAAAFLLEHWRTRLPLGPCHYGIGTLFQQVEYPFRTYNLFHYVYVLSFYPSARMDPRFREALSLLQSKLRDGQIVVERVHPRLAHYSFCSRGEPSPQGTARYREILSNL